MIKPQYRAEIDSLRALAVTAVIIYHAMKKPIYVQLMIKIASSFLMVIIPQLKVLK